MYDNPKKEYNKAKVSHMTLTQMNPYIRYAAVHNVFKHKPFDSICYDCRLFFFREGSGTVTVNETRYPFQRGTALYFPPGTRYRFALDKGCGGFSLVVINFDLTSEFSALSASLGTATADNFDPARLMRYEFPPEFSGILAKNLPDLESPLCRITDSFLEAGALYRETASALLKLSLLELLLGTDWDADRQRIAPILSYIQENCSDPELNNNTVAAAFNYHPYYLSQLVKQAIGQTLHQYILSCRLRMARQLLITTDLPVSTVAWKTGFQSTAYFIKLFKRELGITPGTCRKNHAHILF